MLNKLPQILPDAILSRPRPVARRGSILIMVVAVLVLMALLGTAFISTARIDRAAAADGDVQLPLAYVESVATNAILSDVVVGSAVRPLGNPNYEHFDAPQQDVSVTPSKSKDAWLGSRLPELLTVNCGAALPNMPAWRYVADAGLAFEDVTTGNTLPLAFPGRRFAFIPSSRTVDYRATDPNSPITPRQYPAFRIAELKAGVWQAVRYNGTAWVDATNPNPVTGDWTSYIAGDADGDGIADSLLFRVTSAGSSTRTDYGAIRIIDNSSAVNLNTASNDVRDRGFDAFGNAVPVAGPSSLGFFPAHVGLARLLSDYSAATGGSSQLNELDVYRTGGTATRSAVINIDVRNGPNPAESQNPHPLVAYLSAGDAVFHQFQSRYLNPSFNDVFPATAIKFNLLKTSDNGTNLAYRYVMTSATANADPQNVTPYSPNGSMYPHQAAGSDAEKAIGPSAYATAINHVAVRTQNAFTIYPADGVRDWYDWNFNFGGAAASLYDEATQTQVNRIDNSGNALWRSVRPLLTVNSAVSSGTPKPTAATVPHPSMLPFDLGTIPTYATGTYAPGAFVKHDLGGSNVVVFRKTDDVPGGTATPVDFVVPTTAGTDQWSRESWTDVYGKTSLNTAGFGELFRTFWQVFDDRTTNLVYGTPFPDADITLSNANTDPYIGMKFTTGTFVADPVQNGARMLRSSIRGLPDTGGTYVTTPSPRLPATEQMYLRSAIAAVNTEDLRDSDDDITYRDNIRLQAVDGTMVYARVYGHERQPYITEVFFQNDKILRPTGAPGVNPRGYVAIELYNPHDIAISLANCRLASVNRSNTGSLTAGMMGMATVTALSGVSGVEANSTRLLPEAPVPPGTTTNVVIPPRGYAVLENYKVATPGPTDAVYRPASTGLPLLNQIDDTINAPTQGEKYFYYVPNLMSVIGDGVVPLGRELVLLRPNLAATIASVAPLPTGTSTLVYGPVLGTIDSDELVPLDQFDFTGITGMGATATATVYHYARQSETAGEGWKFVYPGRYDAGKAYADGTTPTASPRHQGVGSATWTPTATPQPPIAPVPPVLGNWDPWDPAVAVTYVPPVPVITLVEGIPTATNARATYPIANVFSIPLLSNDTTAKQAIHDPTGPLGLNRFPFGGFARNADVLDVPFIGAYRIDTDPTLAATANFVYEINSITMDAAMAEDTDTTDDVAGAATDVPEQVGRFVPLRKAVAPVIDDLDPLSTNRRYAFATDVLDRFAALYHPQDDYLPNVLPRNYHYQSATGQQYITQLPEAVMNAATGSAGNKLADAGIPQEGLINVNTAPLQVLAMIPWTNSTAYNLTVAQAIVTHRNNPANGPFRTLFDLGRVPMGVPTTPTLADAWALSRGAAVGADDANWNDTDLGATSATTGDNVLNGYKERHLTLTRVSNLITTRSDAFTVYALVQGWENAGTNTADMTIQRRSAFFYDRASVTPVSTSSTGTRTEIPVK